MNDASPEHHGPGGRFRNPWPEAAGDERLRKRFWKVAAEWFTRPLPPGPEPGALPAEEPRMAVPRAGASEARITWVGHSTTLVQLPGLNVLTDPVWSRRASPLPWFGPERFVPARPDLAELPPVDAVVLSHDHYDHLDVRTVRALAARFGESVEWFTPLGYGDWFGRRGVHRVVELDWWESAPISGGGYRAVCLPARHWTRRRPWDTNRRLWSSWALVPEGDAGASPSVYFGGDSGYCRTFEAIGNRFGPFDVSLLPIGAYDPRWFMHGSHMNPEEAVRAYVDLGGRGSFIATHWGTFRLTFEDPLEPPERLCAAWRHAGLESDALHVLAHGESWVWRGPTLL